MVFGHIGLLCASDVLDHLRNRLSQKHDGSVVSCICRDLRNASMPPCRSTTPEFHVHSVQDFKPDLTYMWYYISNRWHQQRADFMMPLRDSRISSSKHCRSLEARRCQGLARVLGA